jgi:DeoR family deoxyribose operon repressor
MAKQNTRLEKLITRLKENQVLTVKQLAQDLNVSEMTVRRDIALLEQENKVKSFYGGISLAPAYEQPLAQSYTIDSELIERKEQKRRIAMKAASMVEYNDVILIDTGSTTGCMLDYFPEDSFNTVYCYALNILNGACRKNSLNIVACGGFYHSNTGMFESGEGASLILKTQINKAFMAARGVSDVVGITTAEPYEVNMKKAALSVSKQKILLVDSSKFGKSWYAKYADLNEIDIIITDTDIREEHKQMILDKGITLYIV